MHKPDPEQANAQIEEMQKLGYDTRDVDVPLISKAAIGFFVFTTFSVLIGIGVVWAFGLLGSKPHPPVRTSPLAAKDSPQLQTNVTAVKDIATLRREENVRLTTYGWVDKDKGVVRIPVEVAMEMALQKGFAERGVPQPEPAMPGVAPSGEPAPSTEGGVETTPTSPEGATHGG
ncbi:MAG TPA: hypothetical protein PLL78_00815 [Fimbriimonadaceae bacterium]|nr:hypothetical protein [Fimbriimonadaceae bacterium]HRJ95203.1 hypothetical protein [Fimbriimonadaceae bacterium]